AGLIGQVVCNRELWSGGREAGGLSIWSTYRNRASVVEESAARLGEFFDCPHIPLAHADMQRRQYVHINLPKERILLDVVVIKNGPHQIVGPEVWIEIRGADSRIENGVRVDVIAV